MENFDKYIGSTFYFIPYEFKENCKKGDRTEIREMTLTKKEEGDYTRGHWTDDYVFESSKYPTIRFSVHAIKFYLNMKIDTNSGIGLYFTMEDAKKAANAYIEKEIAKAERAIQSAQKRKKNLNDCLI